MSMLNANGNELFYFTAGTGKPIVLVHGFASNHQVNWINTGWVKWFTDRGRQVVAMDLRGHGKSEKFHSPDDYHPRLMGGDVMALMDHLGIDRADLMGYSMGGWISSHLMITHPGRFNAVVLGGIGDNLLNFDNRSEKIAQALTTPYPDQITQPFLQAVRGFADLLGNDIRALSACTRGVYKTGEPDFSGASRPVLLITGAQDDVAGAPDRFTRMIPGARKIIVPACDHLTALTRRAYKEAVIQFLDN